MLDSQFSPELQDALNQMALDPGLGHQRTAVFDADGTLWRADASESLLSWAEQRGHIQAPAGAKDVISYYLERVDADRADGFAWAARQFAGCAVDQVAQWAEACFAAQILPLMHGAMASLVALLQQAGWDLWIVSASPRYAVAPGCRCLGIPIERLLSIEPEVADGVYQDATVGPITSGMGKVVRMKQAMAHAPAFVAGNSIDDLPLLEQASRSALVVDPSDLHQPGLDLGAVARARGWWVFKSV